MFLNILLGGNRSRLAERRFRAVDQEIDAVARHVSRRHRLLAARMKEIAIRKPSELMQAMQIEDDVERVAHIDRLIGKGVRLSPTERTEPYLDQLLASTAEYGWASEACSRH